VNFVVGLTAFSWSTKAIT